LLVEVRALELSGQVVAKVVVEPVGLEQQQAFLLAKVPQLQ
jgi:hypothetical protein